MIETEWRRSVAGKSIVRLPNTSGRKSCYASLILIESVDMTSRVYGFTAWNGQRFGAGSMVEESQMYNAERSHEPVVLELTQAAPIEPGCRVGGRGRLRELSILWQWDTKRGVWRELGRIEGSPLDSAPELRQLARRAIKQELWRETEDAEAAADRIDTLLKNEYAQLGDKRPVVIAILHNLLVTRMHHEDACLSSSRYTRPAPAAISPALPSPAPVRSRAKRCSSEK